MEKSLLSIGKKKNVHMGQIMTLHDFVRRGADQRHQHLLVHVLAHRRRVPAETRARLGNGNRHLRIAAFDRWHASLNEEFPTLAFLNHGVADAKELPQHHFHGGMGTGGQQLESGLVVPERQRENICLEVLPVTFDVALKGPLLEEPKDCVLQCLARCLVPLAPERFKALHGEGARLRPAPQRLQHDLVQQRADGEHLARANEVEARTRLVVLKLQICLSIKEQLDGGDEAVFFRVLLRQQVQHRVQRCVPEGVQRVDFNAWCRQERSHRGDLHLLGRAVQRRFAKERVEGVHVGFCRKELRLDEGEVVGGGGDVQHRHAKLPGVRIILHVRGSIAAAAAALALLRAARVVAFIDIHTCSFRQQRVREELRARLRSILGRRLQEPADEVDGGGAAARR